MNKSQELFEKAKKIIPGGVNSPVRAFRSVGGTLFTKKAHGAKLTTADETELIDYVCTWGPAIHGHDHPQIREALQKHFTMEPVLVLQGLTKLRWLNYSWI